MERPVATYANGAGRPVAPRPVRSPLRQIVYRLPPGPDPPADPATPTEPPLGPVGWMDAEPPPLMLPVAGDAEALPAPDAPALVPLGPVVAPRLPVAEPLAVPVPAMVSFARSLAERAVLCARPAVSRAALRLDRAVLRPVSVACAEALPA